MLQRHWSARQSSGNRPNRGYSYRRRERYSLRVPKTTYPTREYPRSLESIDDWSLYRPRGSPLMASPSSQGCSAAASVQEPRGARRVQSFRCTSKGSVVKMGDYFLGNSSAYDYVCKSDEQHHSPPSGNSASTSTFHYGYHHGAGHQQDQSSVSLAATRGSPTCSRKSSNSCESLRSTKIFHVLIAGYKNVGKHRVMNACLGAGNNLLDESKTTILIDYEQFSIFFRIFDKLEDSDEFPDNQLPNQLMNKCNKALLIIYSIADRKSFEKAGQLLTLAILRHCRKNPNLCVCLVANKSDLVRVRVVTTEEGQDLAKRFGVYFVEVSAEIGENIEDIMVWIVEKIKENLSVLNNTQTAKCVKQATSKASSKVMLRARTCIRQLFKRIMFKSKSVENLCDQ